VKHLKYEMLDTGFWILDEESFFIRHPESSIQYLSADKPEQKEKL